MDTHDTSTEHIKNFFFNLQSLYFFLSFYFLNYECMITHRRLGKYRTRLHIVAIYGTIIF